MNKTEKGTRERRSAVREFSGRWAKLAKHRLRELSGMLKKRVMGMKVPEEAMRRVVPVLSALACTGAGFLMGRCNLGFFVYPLGLALTIAAEKMTFFLYMGSALAALTYPELGLAFFGVNTLIYIIRKILLSDDLSESLRTRVILGVCTGAFISGALFLSDVSQQSIAVRLLGRFDIVLASVAYCVTIPLSVYLMHPILSSKSFGKNRTAVSVTFLCSCLIMSLPFTLPGGRIFSHLLACVLTLFYCVTLEAASAVSAAALFGIATMNFAFAAPLTVSAFLFVHLHRRHQIIAYPAFAALCALITLVVTDFGKLSPHILTAIAAATAIFMPAGLVISSGRALSDLEAPPAREAVGEAYTRRMSELSRAFGSVSKLCYGFAGRLRFPSEDEAQVLIAVEASKFCSRCQKAKECRKKQGWCSGTLAQSLTSSKLNVGMLPEGLQKTCISSRDIVDRVNEEYRKLLSERFCNNKTEILAHEYSAMAKILKYTSRLSSEDVHYDGHLTGKACSAAARLGLPNSGVTVYGTRRKTLDISGVPVSAVTKTSGSLAAYFGSECGTVFDVPEFILDENNTFTMRFVSKEVIAVEYVKAVHTKYGETVCGDTVSFFESTDSYFYALIADGMGSGRDAAMTSRLTSVFVEKLLSGGAGKGVTMELLNSVLMSKSKECFSSVDLLEIDLIERRASFVKAGAAPAYLLRAAKLFKVSSDTPPCGIIEGFCAENTSFEVFSGDIIIMLSDGITSAIDCATALCDIMKEHRESPAETVVQEILDLAVSAAVHDDDMSCVMVRIK